METFPQENPPFPHHTSSTSSTSHHRVPPWLSGPLPPGHGSSSASLLERPSVQKLTAGKSSDSHSPLRGVRTYSHIYKNIDSKPAAFLPHDSQLCFVYIICIIVQLDHAQTCCLLFCSEKMNVEVCNLSASMDHVDCLCPAVAH